MNYESLLQLGFAGFIASYLIIWITKKVMTSQDRVIEILEAICESLDIRIKK